MINIKTYSLIQYITKIKGNMILSNYHDGLLHHFLSDYPYNIYIQSLLSDKNRLIS